MLLPRRLEESLLVQSEPNLNKLLADRKANIKQPKIEESVREEVLKVFKKVDGVEVTAFPQKSGQITDRPVLTLVVLTPEQSLEDPATAIWWKRGRRSTAHRRAHSRAR